MLTNGSMRDLDAMQPQFQCFAATLSPSHAWCRWWNRKPVEVFGLTVADGDIVHADRHGAIIVPRDMLDKLPAAIDLMARREKVILDAAKSPVSASQPCSKPSPPPTRLNLRHYFSHEGTKNTKCTKNAKGKGN